MSKIIFIGTTEFGIPTLKKLKSSHEIALVVTQPDKPAGRSQKLTASPVKVWAEKNDIRVAQPVRISEAYDEIKYLNADLCIVAAYGQIIPQNILDLPRKGCINIHASLLPKYRGASPIQAAIAQGDSETGITVIQMDEKMDHGPILAKQSLPIDSRDTYTSLHQKLAVFAADLTAATVPLWLSGQITPQPQNHDQATYVNLLTKADGKINWSRPAIEIERQIRAYNPEPGTWTTLSGKLVKILEAAVIPDHKIELPGKLYATGGELAVKCLDSGLILKKVKPGGKNEMAGKDFLNGLKNLNDKIFI